MHFNYTTDILTNLGKSKLSVKLTGKIGAVVTGKISTGIELYPTPGKFEKIQVELACGSWAGAEVCLELEGSIKGTYSKST